jgi:hypothetical protein|tara:strand:+ start:1720 stop:1920 length:201 start_codon:yes stop_codon:yes gene_type:complete
MRAIKTNFGSKVTFGRVKQMLNLAMKLKVSKETFNDLCEECRNMNDLTSKQRKAISNLQYGELTHL